MAAIKRDDDDDDEAPFDWLVQKDSSTNHDDDVTTCTIKWDNDQNEIKVIFSNFQFLTENDI